MHSFSYKQLENIVKTTGATGSITNYQTSLEGELLRNMLYLSSDTQKLKNVAKSHNNKQG